MKAWGTEEIFLIVVSLALVVIFCWTILAVIIEIIIGFKKMKPNKLLYFRASNFYGVIVLMSTYFIWLQSKIGHPDTNLLRILATPQTLGCIVFGILVGIVLALFQADNGVLRKASAVGAFFCWIAFLAIALFSVLFQVY